MLNLGILAEAQSDFPAALGHAQRAFDRFAPAGHAHGQANALDNIGWYRIQLDDYESALDHCRRALVLQEETGNTYWQAHTRDSPGSAHHHLDHHHHEAIHCFSRPPALWRDAGERLFEATTLTHLGDSQQAVDDTGSARSAWSRAVAILDDLAHPDAGPVRARLHAAPTVTRTGADR